MYRWLYFIHLASVFTFLAAHGTSVASSFWLKKESNPAVARVLLQLSMRSYPLMYGSILLILASGLAMGFMGRWWSQLWIWAGLGVFVATVVAMGFMVDNYRQARSAGPGEDERVLSQLRLTRPRLLLGIGVASLVVLLWLMTFKPF